MMIDLAIFIIVRLCLPGCVSGAPGSEPEAVDAAGDLLAHLCDTFVRHVRQHETLSQRHKSKKQPNQQKKRGKEEGDKADILTCLPSALTFLKLL